MRLMKDAVWFWGRVSAWTLKRHVSTELRPFATEVGHDRELVYRVLEQRMRKNFDAAWPQSHKEACGWTT